MRKMYWLWKTYVMRYHSSKRLNRELSAAFGFYFDFSTSITFQVDVDVMSDPDLEMFDEVDDYVWRCIY